MTVQIHGRETFNNSDINTPDIDGGTLDGCVIGGATPAAGEFTTLGASGLISADGSQIAFPATAVPSADANTLDDYEEGTWTPTIADVDIGGNTGSTGTGYYTKVGNIITCIFTLSNIDTTGLTAGNDAYIQGLPFVPALIVAKAHGSVHLDNVAFAEYVTLECIGGKSSLAFAESASGAGGDRIIVSQITDDTGDISGSIVYYA